MPPQETVRALEMARGASIKRRNAITAILTGGVLAIAAERWYGFPFTTLRFLGGVVCGLLYANTFEYFLHRFGLHWGEGFLVQRHALHHNSAGAPDEARYVNFATSPLVVILVFALNAPAALAVEGLLHAGLAAGMLCGFTAYYVLYEEIHWRIHFGGWLPGWLRFARRHHMLHHAGRKGRNSVFLPLFDWLFERREWRGESS